MVKFIEVIIKGDYLDVFDMNFFVLIFDVLGRSMFFVRIRSGVSFLIFEGQYVDSMFKFFYNLLNFSFYLLENVIVLLFFRLEVLYSFIIMIFCEKL